MTLLGPDIPPSGIGRQGGIRDKIDIEIMGSNAPKRAQMAAAARVNERSKIAVEQMMQENERNAELEYQRMYEIDDFFRSQGFQVNINGKQTSISYNENGFEVNANVKYKGSGEHLYAVVTVTSLIDNKTTAEDKNTDAFNSFNLGEKINKFKEAGIVVTEYNSGAKVEQSKNKQNNELTVTTYPDGSVKTETKFKSKGTVNINGVNMVVPKGSVLVEIKNASGNVVFNALNPSDSDLASVTPNLQNSNEDELKLISNNTVKSENMNETDKKPQIEL